MRATIVISAIASFWAAAATAAPVNLQTNVWAFHVGGVVHGYSGQGGGQDSCYSCFRSTPQFTLEDDVTGALGDASYRATATMTTTLSEDEDTLSLHGLATGEAAAEVDAGLTGGGASANAAVRQWLVQFEVLEPVIYTGTHSIFRGRAMPNYIDGPEFLSGSILEPGIYARVFFGPYALADARAGQSDYDYVSAAYEMTFARVPEPASVVLMLLGIAGIVTSRRRVAQRTH